MQEMQETWVWSLGQENPLEEEVATHSSILAWRTSRTEELGGLLSIGLQRVQHDWGAEHTSYIFSLYLGKEDNFLRRDESFKNMFMLVILQARLQQYVNRELPDVQTGFRKGRGTRGQIANIRWIIEKAREFQKNIYFCFIDYAKAFVWITINCGKFWKRWEYQTTWPASWETGQEATVRTGHGTTDWFQIGKGVRQGCTLSPCSFNL